jgi:hypothetical protein
MDLDRDDFLDEQGCSNVDVNIEHSFCDIAMSAAAFAPMQQMSPKTDKKNLSKKAYSTNRKLKKVWYELKK